MRIRASMVMVFVTTLVACGSSDRRPAEPEQAGTSENCAAICKQSSPQTADYVACLEECPGPETTGDRTADDDAP